MAKSALSKIGVAIVTVALVCGCAALGKGPSDEELIRTLLEKWKAAGEALDIEAQFALCSGDFESNHGDEAATRAFLLEANEMGYLEDIEISLDDAEITIEGNTATVYPIEVETAMAGTTAELRLTKQATGWVITGMDTGY